METIGVDHSRNHNQYYGRIRDHGPASDSGSFRDINCRSFQSEAGLLPSPLKSCTTTAVVSKRAFSAPFSPKTPSPSVNEIVKTSKKTAISSVIPITVKIKFEEHEGCLVDDFLSSERWAGPAYSNSPPPSSLPMPKFSLCPKRTVSLDLPTPISELDLHLVSKSAPASPTRERSPSSSNLFVSAATKMTPINLFNSADSATKTLRRILNLDVSDEWRDGAVSAPVNKEAYLLLGMN